MSNIGISIGAENRELLSTLSSSEAALRRFSQSSSSSMQGFSQAARQSEDAVTRLYQGMQTAFIGGGIAAGLITLQNGIQGVTQALVEAQTSSDKLTNTLSFALGADKAAQEVAYLKAMTQELGVSYGATTQMYARFAASTKGTVLEGQKTRDIFESVSQASVVMGLSVEESEGMFRALTQMVSKGVIQAEELRGQLGERLPGAFKLFADSMNVSTAELSKMLEAGQVGPEKLAEFEKFLRSNLAPSLESATQSMQANINRLGNEWLWFKQAVVNSGVGAAMSDALGSATTALGGARAGIEAATDSGAAMRTVFDAAGIAAVALGGSIASRVVTALRDKTAAASADRAAMLATAAASATEAQATATSTAAKLADLRATEASIVATRQQAIEEMKAASAAAQSAQSLNARQSALVRYTAAQMELNATASRQQAVHGELSQALAQHQTATDNASTATRNLEAAQNAASVSGRAMGAVMGALGGPVGIAITAITLLIGKLVSLQSAANDAALAGLSRDRVNQASANGAQAEVEDLAAIRTELQKLKRERDQLTLDQKDTGLLGAIFGGDYASGIVNQLNAVNAKIAENEQVLQRQTASQNGTAGAITNTAAAQSNALQALLRTTEGVRTASSINDDYAKKLSAAQAALKNYLATETDASKASEAQRRFKEYQVELTKGRDAALKSLNKTTSNASAASRDYDRAVDAGLASLQARTAEELIYSAALAQHGTEADKMLSGEREVLKLRNELTIATAGLAQATTKDGRSKIETRIATLNLHMAEAVRLADVQRQNQITKESLELGQKAITDLQKQADAIRDKTAALAEENAAYGQINPALAKALAQRNELAGQMVMTDGSVMDYERAQRAAEAWALMNGYIDQLMKQDWNKINGAVQEWQRSATEQAALYEDEARLSGLTALERAKVVAASQVELKLKKQIAEIERAKFSEDPVKDAAQKAKLIADATTAAQTESSAAVAKVVQEDWTRTSEKIEEVLIDALMDGGKSGAEYIEGLFRSMVLRPVIQAIVSPVAGAVTSAMGFSGAAQAGQAGGGMSGIGALNTAYSAITTGIRSSIASNFEKLVTNGVGEKLGLSYSYGDGNTYQMSKLGEQFSGVAQGLGSTMTAYGLQKSLSGGYQTGASGLVDAATAIGGFFDPTGGLIAGAIGGSVNRAFGRKLKDQGLEGTFGGADGFDGNYYEFYKGGWFRSDKTKRKPLDADVEDALETQFKALQIQTDMMAQTLGLGVDSVVDFTAKIKVSFKGLSEEQISERMAEEFGKVAESMASAALGTTEYTRTGETAVETLTRLSSSLTTVNGTFDVLGQTLYATSLAGADMASQLVDLMGGLESFTATTASYLQNFYTEAERADVATRQLTEALSAIGVNTLPATRDAYRALVEAQDLTTESGRETYAALLGLNGAFAALVPATEAAADAVETIEQAYQRLTNVTFTAEQAAEQRIGLEEKLLTLQGNTTELRRRELQAIDASNRGLQRLVWTLEDVQSASALVLDAEKQLADAQAQAQQQQYDTQYEAAKAIADAARTAADEMKSLADTLREFVLGETQTPSELFADTLKKALGGDVEAMRALPQVATSQIDAARQSASTQADYAIARAQTLNAVQAAAAIAGQLGAVSVVDPVRQVAQPTAAQDPTQEALGKLNTAIEVLTMSIATAVGGDLADKLGKIDTNLDGSVSESEFKAAFNGTASDNVLSKIFAALDSDDSKMITKLEAIKNNTAGLSNAIGGGTASQVISSPSGMDRSKFESTLKSEAVANNVDLNSLTTQFSSFANGVFSSLDTDSNNLLVGSEVDASKISAAVKTLIDTYTKPTSSTGTSNTSTAGNSSAYTPSSSDLSSYKSLIVGERPSGSSKKYEQFVYDLYIDYARRQPEISGFNYWVNTIKDGVKSYPESDVLAQVEKSFSAEIQGITKDKAFQEQYNYLIGSSLSESAAKYFAGISSYAVGGYTGPGGKYEAAGVVHRGEVVFSQDDIARLGGVRAVEAIRTGEMPGYATGGTVGAPVVVPAPMFVGRKPADESSGFEGGDKAELLAEFKRLREAFELATREIKSLRRDNNLGHKKTEAQVTNVARTQRGWTANGLPAQEGAAFA